MAAPYIVYIIRSQSSPTRHYTGITGRLTRRLRQHNLGLSASTADHRPWHLLVAVHFPDPQRALAFERYLKSASGRAFSKKHF